MNELSKLVYFGSFFGAAWLNGEAPKAPGFLNTFLVYWSVPGPPPLELSDVAFNIEADD